MAVLTQRQMLETLVEDVRHIKGKQSILEEKQDGMDLKLTNIDIELTGTSYDKTKGIVPRLNRAERCITEMKKRQAKITAWGGAIFGVITIAGIIIAIINNIRT